MPGRDFHIPERHRANKDDLWENAIIFFEKLKKHKKTGKIVGGFVEKR